MYIDSLGNKWYRGNLHTHTTQSDGRLPIDEVIELYKSNGYDFMAITDHWVYSQEKKNDDFLVMSGCEYHTGANVREGVYHIVSVGSTQQPNLKKNPDGSFPPALEIIDEIKAAGGFAMIAHPAWSLDEPSELLKLSKLDALEIYNTVSGPPWSGRPYSGFIADRLASDGMLLRLLAVDDTHFYTTDPCRSYIMVNAENLNSESILDALYDGRFYSTQGPHFSYTLEGGILTVKTTAVREITFHSDVLYASDRIASAAEGETITEASYKIKKGETFVRFELVDAAGLLGWSDYIEL